MKLKDVSPFDPYYYEYLQDELALKNQKVPDDTTTGIPDFLVSAYKLGKLTYKQAYDEIEYHTDGIERDFWIMELNAIRELKLEKN